jgi:hypothetical protein
MGFTAFALLTGFFVATTFVVAFFAFGDDAAAGFVTFPATAFFPFGDDVCATFVVFFVTFLGVAFFLVVFFFVVAILTSLELSFKFHVPGFKGHIFLTFDIRHQIFDPNRRRAASRPSSARRQDTIQ